ncbi:MAG: anhydro-N-acetylmuramic acid kinase [Gammaproteobacteria bacterium]|nr:anhydro-N-acetylmuramic acid kinase [Gammaproteobacteria bacterium]
MKNYYVGLMSGTSGDGVDAVLASIPDHGAAGLTLEHTFYQPYTGDLQSALTALTTAGNNELHRAAILSIRLADVFVQAVFDLIGSRDASTISAIGSHGHTVRHAPGADPPYTVQLGCAARLAERTGITVVSDFRARDLAAGGTGAPLAPAFHRAVFSAPGKPRAIVNIGGIANLSVLDGKGGAGGFDCGPGNALMDEWTRRHRGQNFDRDGAWALSGKVQEKLLRGLLADRYFSAPPPKSTGREYFNAVWLAPHLKKNPAAPADVQATLAALTADSIAAAIRRSFPAESDVQVYICGGGARNAAVMQCLGAHGLSVATTAALGIAPDWVEAAAFAWLAARTLGNKPGNLPAVTGARRAAVLGTVCPGR